MAIDRLHATNNFPEFTGHLCPAPCEGACVLGINNDAVAIKSIEVSIINRAFDEGWVAARPPARRTGKRVAIIGSGPAGLAAADQLNRAGHLVTVLERADRIGGLLRYGIPEFKLEKRVLDRRLSIMRDAGVTGDEHGRVTTLHAAKVEVINNNGRLEFKAIEGSEFEMKADLVLLAMGFLGPERGGMLDQLGVRMSDRGTVWRDERWMTSVPGVFTAGDMQRGQSLIVWAMAEGRSCARGVDTYLMGSRAGFKVQRAGFKVRSRFGVQRSRFGVRSSAFPEPRAGSGSVAGTRTRTWNPEPRTQNPNEP